MDLYPENNFKYASYYDAVMTHVGAEMVPFPVIILTHSKAGLGEKIRTEGPHLFHTEQEPQSEYTRTADLVFRFQEALLHRNTIG